MNRFQFQNIYKKFQQSEDITLIQDILSTHLSVSLSFLQEAIQKEKDDITKEKASACYESMITEHHSKYIYELFSKNYISIENLFCQLSIYLFGLSLTQSEVEWNKWLTKLEKRLEKSNIDSKSPEEVLQLIHEKITQSFLIDDSISNFYNFNEVIACQTISHYTLSITIMALAERLQLPIYGIPFDDKLVLCYAQTHCLHNEMVVEEDILYYLVIGEKNLIYTSVDLKMYGMLLRKELELDKKLPRSPQTIIKKWLEHLMAKDFGYKFQVNLSSKYQQIFSHVREFDSFC